VRPANPAKSDFRCLPTFAKAFSSYGPQTLTSTDPRQSCFRAVRRTFFLDTKPLSPLVAPSSATVPGGGLEQRAGRPSRHPAPKIAQTAQDKQRAPSQGVACATHRWPMPTRLSHKAGRSRLDRSSEERESRAMSAGTCHAGSPHAEAGCIGNHRSSATVENARC